MLLDEGCEGHAKAGNISNFPFRKPTSPNMSVSPSGPTWALWRKSPKGGLIISLDRRSLSFGFLPCFGAGVFKYIGVLAGILFSQNSSGFSNDEAGARKSLLLVLALVNS